MGAFAPRATRSNSNGHSGERMASCCDCVAPGAGKFQGATYCAKHLAQRQGSAAAVESFPPCATCGKPGTHPFRGHVYCLTHNLDIQRSSPAIPELEQSRQPANQTRQPEPVTASALDDDIPF